jgi:hypothetical protein
VRICGGHRSGVSPHLLLEGSKQQRRVRGIRSGQSRRTKNSIHLQIESRLKILYRRSDPEQNAQSKSLFASGCQAMLEYSGFQ